MFNSKNNKSEKFRVLCYSGYKGDETPRSVVVGEKEYPLEGIISRERVFDSKTGKSFEIFTSKIEGKVVKIKRDEWGEWTVIFSKKP